MTSDTGSHGKGGTAVLLELTHSGTKVPPWRSISRGGVVGMVVLPESSWSRWTPLGGEPVDPLGTTPLFSLLNLKWNYLHRLAQAKAYDAPVCFQSTLLGKYDRQPLAWERISYTPTVVVTPRRTRAHAHSPLPLTHKACRSPHTTFRLPCRSLPPTGSRPNLRKKTWIKMVG
ncbi:hypothetical protein BC835DRAFT_185402 [Cytidiella melzeri]|nr:hypothetical protein BC835DRAFT_185402 [Cytidiella melzeri]